MGIDVYARWRNQTEEESQAQCTGFDSEAGEVGYLREAYHGSPYVTKFLVEEAFYPEDEHVRMPDGAIKMESELTKAERDDCEYDTLGIQIPAKVMRDRLPHAVALALYRELKVYGQGKKPGHIDIGKEGEMEDFQKTLNNIFVNEVKDNSHKFIAASFPDSLILTVTEMIENRKLPPYALAFVDFVELAEKVEKRTGEPIFVYASA